jgi:hypothetical protein
MVLAAYPKTRSGDAWAPCGSHSERSLHDSGKAWDWVLADGDVVAPAELRAQADELLEWLLEDLRFQRDMRARRLGIVEMIWFGRLWTSETKKWDPYPLADCSDPEVSNNTCHRNHVHFTFSDAGAGGRTTWWDGFAGFIASLLDRIFQR